MRKFYNSTGNKFHLRIKWITRKTKTLFKLKDKSLHATCNIYHGVCSYGETYIGESVRNVEPRWNKHNKPSKKSKPLKHLNSNVTHHFSWPVICNAPVKKFTYKILEAYFVVLLKPTHKGNIESDFCTFLRMELCYFNVN